MLEVGKAVIPAAGMGTRFLPVTKAIPKEMIPLVDKPTIQYVVEELIQSGLKQVLFVTSRGKEGIEDYFDHNQRLEVQLREANKGDLLGLLQDVTESLNVASVRQKKPLGLGHAIQITEPFVGQEPFAVLLPDDVIVGEIPCLKQLLDLHRTYEASVIAALEVPSDQVSRYGVLDVEPVGKTLDGVFKVRDMVEKPPAEKAPSNLAIIGRYVLTPGIFTALAETDPGALGEVQLTDGLRALVQKEPVYACCFKGTLHDVGTKLGYLISTVELALQHKELGDDFRQYLQGLKI